jgi:hypothetical protein
MKKLLFVFALCALLIVPSVLWAADWTVGVDSNGWIVDIDGGYITRVYATGTFTGISSSGYSLDSSALTGITWTYTITDPSKGLGSWIVEDSDGTDLIAGDLVCALAYSTEDKAEIISDGVITTTYISEYVPSIGWAVGSTGTVTGLLNDLGTHDAPHYAGNFYVNKSSVPEPMSIILGIMGLGSIAGFKKFRK